MDQRFLNKVRALRIPEIFLEIVDNLFVTEINCTFNNQSDLEDICKDFQYKATNILAVITKLSRAVIFLKAKVETSQDMTNCVSHLVAVCTQKKTNPKEKKRTVAMGVRLVD